MNGKLTLSFSVATFIAALGVMYVLSGMRTRLIRLERSAAEQGVTNAPPEKSTRSAATEAADEPDTPRRGEEEVAPLDTKDKVVKLDWLINKLDEVDTRLYDGVVDLEQELYELKRKIDKITLVQRRMLDGLRSSGQFEGFASTLPEPKTPLTPEQKRDYMKEAASYGITVEDGRVVARGLLNGSQDKKYPIEYFMTRFPDNGHETLVHLLGTAKLEEFAEPPFPNLQGVPTALYKALIAAGFTQGKGSHPEPTDEPLPPGTRPNWVLATGDVVYMYVRWEENGETKMVRASDWIIDPETNTTLPEDCFRFTGSMRVENMNTGDEMLLAEARGFLVSVYPDPAAMIEVALPSASNNNYGYNWTRLPKNDGEKPFYVDVILSRTPLKKTPVGDKPQDDK